MSKYFIDKDMKPKITSWSSLNCIIIVLVEQRGKIQFRYSSGHSKCSRAASDFEFRFREEVLESVSVIKRAACTDPMHGRFAMGDSWHGTTTNGLK